MDDYKMLIRTNRIQKGISQNKLSKMVGITQPFLAEIESGRKQPSIDVLSRLCNVLDIRIFFNNNDDEAKVLLSLFDTLSKTNKKQLLEYAKLLAETNAEYN